MVSLLKWVAVVSATLYVVIIFLLYVLQDRLVFPAPLNIRHIPLATGCETRSMVTSDGIELRHVWCEAGPEAPVVLFFHGNGSAALLEQERARMLVAAGYSVLLVEYRGYGGSSGLPTSQALLSDSLEIFDWLRESNDQPVYLYAHSLGTGIAVKLASKRKIMGMALESAYASFSEVAANQYPWLPVSLLFKHPIEAHTYVDIVDAPILFLHGSEDTLIPVKFGRSLHAASTGSSNRFEEIPGAGHNDLMAFGSTQHAIAFFDAITQHRK